MSTNLTYEDVKKLMEQPTVAVRQELASKLALSIDSPQLTDQELALAHDIIRVLARDVEIQVRQSLAQNLRNAQRLPHDVAVKLANDIENVALPLLEHSDVLNDEDLIAVISAGSIAKQSAIACRVNVSENLSDALITQAAEEAVVLLMKNTGAQIAPHSFDKALNRFESSTAVHSAMVMRPTLPVTVAERLVTVVSDHLRNYLVMHHELSPEIASDMVLQSRERTVIHYAFGSQEEEVEKLVQQMYRNQRLSSSIILRALCTGDVVFFETAMSVMANVPLLNARKLIHDSGYLGLKSLWEKAGLSMGLMSIIRIALDVVHETEYNGSANDRERYRARVIERILTQSEHIDRLHFDYLMKKLGDVMQLSLAV